MSENEGDNPVRGNHSGSESLPDESSLFTRRAALKIGVFSIAIGVGATETIDSASANSDGYGLGRYGEGPYGDPSSFTVETDAPTDVNETAITFNGTLTGLGDATSADVYFKWGKVGDNLPNTTTAQTLSGTDGYSITVDELSSGTKYEYRTVAEDDNGNTATGTVRTVSTDSVLAVTTESPTTVGETSVTLSGTLSDLGGASSADVYFEWGKSGESLSNATTTQTVSSPTTFTGDITGLTSGADYVYRAVAAAADGDTDAGSKVLFTTAGSDTPPAIDSYTVTEAGKKNPHATITADWSVSDADADLESVVVEVYDPDGNLMDSARTAVSGADTSGTDSFSFKRVRNWAFNVLIRVTDVAGNTTEQTQLVTE